MNAEDKRPALKGLKTLIRTGEHQRAFRELKDMAEPLDGFPLQSQYARILHSMDMSELNLRPIRIALLGSSTLDHFAEVFRYWLAAEGFNAELYVGPYDTLRQSILDPTDEMYRFDPDLVWLFTHERDVRFNVESGADQAAVANAVEDTVADFKALWEAIKSRSRAFVIQNNADVPSRRVFGTLEGSALWSRTNLLRRFNLELAASLPPGVTVFDLEHVASFFGKQRWYDYRYWYHSKHAFSLDASGVVAFHGARLVGAVKGASKKCVILDLDNTLWGGVIGDDGVDGIRLGTGADGEAFADFQQYLRQLKERGIILAVCSKNEEDAAMAPFLNHPDMRLSLEDIAVFKANWNNKADNIRDIVGTLNIGMDSIVFVDDNPAERELVRSMLPSVTVPEISDDPAEYVCTLDGLCLFDTTSFSSEDKMRGRMYRDNAMRQEFSRQFSDLSAYLRSLDMEAIVGECDPFHVKRMAQIINKSNQFHLTGTRYTESELTALSQDPGKVVRYFTLKDRFGDNGLISVVIMDRCDADLVVDTWVMSCRVLSRGMEEFICREMIAVAEEQGCQRIIGTYVPSKKNRMVANLYERLHFRKLVEEQNGITRWVLTIGPDIPSYEIHIRRQEDHIQQAV